MYKYVAMLVVVLEAAIVLFGYRRNPRLVIYAVIISIALKGQYIWIGRALYAWQVAALIGFLYLSSRGQALFSSAGGSLDSFRMTILFYFMYGFIISIPTWFLFGTDSLYGAVVGDGFSRAITQTIYFCFSIGLFGFGVLAGRFLTTFGFLRAFIVIATIVAYGAILQVLVFTLTKINLFPIIGSDDTVRSAFIRDTIFRTTSFAGEPKHLGLLMATGVILFFLTRLFRIPIGGRFSFHMPLAMVVALLLSLSTTGIGIAIAGIGVTTVVFFRRLRGADLMVIGIIVTVIMTQVIGGSGDFSFAFERQVNKFDFEVQDESIRLALFDNPLLLLAGSGLGNIHLIAVNYLPADFPLFRDGGYKGNSGLFYVLGDSGLIGLMLLLAAPLFAMQGYVRMRSNLPPVQRREAVTALALILVSLLSFLMRYDVFYFLLSGFVFARLSILRGVSLRDRRSATAAAPARLVAS